MISVDNNFDVEISTTTEIKVGLTVDHELTVEFTVEEEINNGN